MLIFLGQLVSTNLLKINLHMHKDLRDSVAMRHVACADI